MIRSFLKALSLYDDKGVCETPNSFLTIRRQWCWKKDVYHSMDRYRLQHLNLVANIFCLQHRFLASTKFWKFLLEFGPRSYHSFISIFVPGTNDQRASNGRLQNFDDGSTTNEPTIYNLLKMNYWILEKIHVNAEINEWQIRNSGESFFNQPRRRYYFGLLVPAKPFRGQKVRKVIWYET